MSLLTREQSMAHEILAALTNPKEGVDLRALDFVLGLIDGRYRCIHQDDNEHMVRTFPRYPGMDDSIVMHMQPHTGGVTEGEITRGPE